MFSFVFNILDENKGSKKISKTNKKFCFILLNAKLLSNILYELFIDTREIIINAALALTLIFNR